MRVTNTARRAGWVTAGLAVLAVGSAAPRVPLLLYNRTPSMPTGFYVRVGGVPGRGDIVAFHLPGAAWEYARDRGEPTHIVLLKHVLAVGGDHVSTRGGRLSVNGVDCGPIPVVDSAGRALPQWRADRLLAADELLAGSTLPRSFDGRFFGTIERADVMGVYRRVAVGVASTVTTDPSVVGHPTTSPSPAELRDQPIRLRRPRARMEEIVPGSGWVRR
jgi:conjugative transfer signal peptidase TraF